MRGYRFKAVVVLFTMWLLIAVFALGVGHADDHGTVVALVMPRNVETGLPYSVTISGTTYQSTGEVLDGLRLTRGKTLMILARADLPIGRVVEVLSMAVKTAYLPEDIRIFTFTVKRGTITSMCAPYKQDRFTEDPVRLDELSGGARE